MLLFCWCRCCLVVADAVNYLVAAGVGFTSCCHFYVVVAAVDNVVSINVVTASNVQDSVNIFAAVDVLVASVSVVWLLLLLPMLLLILLFDPAADVVAAVYVVVLRESLTISAWCTSSSQVNIYGRKSESTFAQTTYTQM